LFPGLLRSSVTFTINESITILVMVIFGGISTLFGPILMAGELRLVVYGIALIIFIIWMPVRISGTPYRILLPKEREKRRGRTTCNRTITRRGYYSAPSFSITKKY
jgi:hypothetical protein